MLLTDQLSEHNWILTAHLIENTNAIRATSLKDLSGVRNHVLRKSDEDPTSWHIHSCVRKREEFHTSIALKNQHFLARRKLNSTWGDIRVSTVTRHAPPRWSHRGLERGYAGASGSREHQDRSRWKKSQKRISDRLPARFYTISQGRLTDLPH